MKRYTYIIITALLLLNMSRNTRASDPGTATILERLFNRILMTNIDDERIRLNDSIRIIIDSYAASDSVFTHKFTNLRYLGQIKSSDGTIKMITWNIILRDGGNKYFLYIIRKGNKNASNRIYKLDGNNREGAPATDSSYTVSDWYGALYYAMQPFKKDGRQLYAIIGIDYGNTYLTRKIIDVLSFNPEGEIIFGNDCFSRDGKISERVVMEYSSEAVITLRLYNNKTIVFDRLASISDDKSNSPESLGSEYRFDGYKLKKGLWSYVTNVDVRNKK